MSIIENIEARMDDNEFAAGVFADLEKTFDTVDYLLGNLSTVE